MSSKGQPAANTKKRRRC